MSDSPRDELERRLAGFRRRHLWVAWLGLFLESLFLGGFLLACLLLADRTLALLRGEAPWMAGRDVVGAAVLALGGVSAAVALGLAWWKAPRGTRFAWAIDRRLGAEDRVATAAEVARAESAGVLGRALLHDALSVLGGISGERLFPRPRFGHRFLVVLPLAVIVWLLTVPSPAPAGGTSGPGSAGLRVPPSGPPLADFEAGPRRGAAPCSVRFRALPVGRVDRYRWDFGDGAPAVSGAEAFHTYRAAGAYTVRLEVYGPGGADVEVKPAYIRVMPPGSVVADFSGAPRHGIPPLAVRFVARLEGDVTSLRWIFGDGAAAEGDRSPEHVYAAPGRFSVRLDAKGPGGGDSVVKEGYVTVGAHPPPEARFTAAPRQGAAPLRVRFHDRSLGTVHAWRWDFGDGTPAGTGKDPEHVFERPGVYSVTMSVSGPGGGDVETKKNYIVVSDDLSRGGGSGGGTGRAPGDGEREEAKPAGGGASASPPPGGAKPRPGTEPPAKPPLGEAERTPVTTTPREVAPLLQEGGKTKIRSIDVYEGEAGGAGGAKPEAYDVLYAKYRRQAEQSVHGETIAAPVRDLVKRYFETIRPDSDK